VPYAPSYGAQVLYIEVEPFNKNWSTSNLGGSLKITVDLTTGALNGGAWIGSTQLDGTAQRVIAGRVQQQPVLCGWVDLTGVSKGIAASPFIKISVDNNSSDARGICRVHCVEVPLASYDPSSSTSEVSVDPGSFASGTPIIAGDSGSSAGFYRIASQLDNARYKTRRHMSIFTAEVDGGTSSTNNPLWVTSTSRVAINEAASTVTGQPVDLWCRARRLYTTSTANKYKLVVRYKNTAATSATGPDLRLAITPSGGSTTNTDVALPDTSSGSGSGVWTDYLHSSNIDVPTSGTDQLVKVRLTAKVQAAAETFHIAALALIENES
jgi:hypothetical protein